MFKINYRIILDQKNLEILNQNDWEEGEEYLSGFFQLIFNNCKYGYYHDQDLKEDENDYELIMSWFELLIQGYNALKHSNYVAIRDFETLDYWIEFIRCQEIIYVSKMRYRRLKGHSLIIVQKPNLTELSYPEWKSIRILLSELREEIITKGNLYFDEIKKISPNFSNNFYISSVISQLRKMETDNFKAGEPNMSVPQESKGSCEAIEKS